ncbi:hypothetical protein BGC31_08150 [Komagataeibacter xylinus]|nr:hypothetical protein H845_1462 [Komagataeibacter xylinus E25]RFO99361.1 hypothetical protein BGC31_08150 [Komagataeibacter xylinus]RFP07792.1 hypothetical protein BFX83_00680 [Komagataeibacter xylinus]
MRGVRIRPFAFPCPRGPGPRPASPRRAGLRGCSVHAVCGRPPGLSSVLPDLPGCPSGMACFAPMAWAVFMPLFSGVSSRRFPFGAFPWHRARKAVRVMGKPGAGDRDFNRREQFFL